MPVDFCLRKTLGVTPVPVEPYNSTTCSLKGPDTVSLFMAALHIRPADKTARYDLKDRLRSRGTRQAVLGHP